MTLIIGYETKDGFIIAADSAVSWGDFVRTKLNRKVAIKGDVVVACAGESAITGYVVECFEFDPVEGNPMKYLHSQVDKLQTCLRGTGIINGKSLREATTAQDINFSLVVGIGNEVYEIDSWMSIERLNGPVVVGSGRDFALGALHAFKSDPINSLRIAFEAANHYMTTVAPPYHAIIKENGELREVTLG